MDLCTLKRLRSNGGFGFIDCWPGPRLGEGQEVAQLVVTPSEGETLRFPLFAGASVEQKGPFGRLVAAVEFLIFGAP